MFIKILRLVLLILIIIGLALVFTRGLWLPKLVDFILQTEGVEGQVIKAKFVCAGDKSVETRFHNYEAGAGTVDLKLSDGRELTLDHAISADGARYANGDESFVFWNKGNTAFITEGNNNTYTGCVTK